MSKEKYPESSTEEMTNRQQSPVVGMQIDGESEIQGPAAKYDMHSIQEVGSKETQDSDSYGEIILLRESKILTTSENTLIDTTRFQSENHSFLNYELQEASVSHRKSEKPPMCGFCWVNGRGIEMINQQTGKLTNDGIPRLSKNVLRKRLEQLARPSSTETTPVQYQKAKETFYQYLEANGLGKWHKHTA